METANNLKEIYMMDDSDSTFEISNKRRLASCFVLDVDIMTMH